MRLIDADALKANLPEPTNITQMLVYRTLCDLIDNAPTVEERPQGKWICDYRTNTCSICNYVTVIDTYNYCPNCGAKMTQG